jgi:signal transduction protein with GAF and PtsI domain
LLLDVAKAAGTTLDLKDALQYIVETISLKLQHDNCSLYMLDTEQKAFCIEASNVTDEHLSQECISLENDIMNEMITTLRPVIISDEIQKTEKTLILKQYKTALALPVIRDNKCLGLLLVRRCLIHLLQTDDTLKLLSHTMNLSDKRRVFQSTKNFKITVL